MSIVRGAIRQPLITIALLSAALAATFPSTALSSFHWQYLSPQPGARYVSRGTNIIIRPGALIDEESLKTPGLLRVEGSASGSHPVTLSLSDDGRTVIARPVIPFTSGERVLVMLGAGMRTLGCGSVPPMHLTFTISENGDDPIPVSAIAPGLNDGFPSVQTVSPSEEEAADSSSASPPVYPLPIDFPYLKTTTYDSPSPGRIFISNFAFDNRPNTPYLLILDNTGVPIWYKRMRSSCTEFKVQPDGSLTYYSFGTGVFTVMDSNYNVTGTVHCGNGYSTDLHELRVLPDNHVYLMSYDPQKVNMSGVIAGGRASAQVIGLVIQELDRSRNVVFQWRSWDHFQITDATHEDLTAPVIDYAHGNAIEVDADSNLLISSRHMDEITKIDRRTGDIIWRFGGKNNEFTFTNDTLRFSHQHAVRRLPNGDVTMFDNGNYHTPQFSRAVEYQIDGQQKTATMVWQFRNAPDTYGLAMGYVQRLPNGNTLIGWGAANPTVTEVRPDGSKAYELSLSPGVFSYRAFRFPWKEGIVPPTPPLTFSLLQNYPNPFNPTTKIRIDLNQEATVTLKVYDGLGNEVGTILDGIRKSPGEYETAFSASKLASGIYYYRLTTDNASETRKMIYVK